MPNVSESLNYGSSKEHRPLKALLPREVLQRVPPRHMGSGVYLNFGVSSCDPELDYSDAAGKFVDPPELPVFSTEGELLDYLAAEVEADDAWILQFLGPEIDAFQ